MATRLGLYNAALLHLGARALASLNESNQTRRDCDRAWDGGFVDEVLERGQWKFAIRAREMAYSPSITPAFGSTLAYVFDIPSDHRRLVGSYSDADMGSPLLEVDFREEGGYWLASQGTIWVRYVSNDASFGGDMSLWPASFTAFCAALFAAKIAMAVTGDTAKRDDMLALAEKRLLPVALSRDAMQEPSRLPRAGGWVSSRTGTRRSDLGIRSRLT